MPSVLSDHDKENVKRLVPKASNKIQAVAVARLYIAKPGQSRWIYTGLQGAAVLSNDLVGNTFWIKLVDISPANRGVIWDQEIYDAFQYNQDRTFFHSFELEQCIAALSFVDEKEARQFKKKMDEREKNASKATQRTPFGSAAGGGQIAQTNGAAGHKSHSRLGGLFGRHRNSSNPQPPQPQMGTPQPIYSQPVYSSVPTGVGGSRSHNSGEIDLTDPKWQPILDELVQMGITEDQIAQNADFIKAYVEKKQAEEMATGIASALPRQNSGRAPPPPPPPAPAAQRLTPENTGTSSRRAPPPAAPPSRKPAPGRASPPPREPSPAPTPSPPSTPQARGFRVPPPLADAGKFAKDASSPASPASPARARATSGAALANPGPPPPPRPPKEPDHQIPGQVFKAPPPFTGQRQSSAPPPPPSRGPVPPPPPSRDSSAPVPPPPRRSGAVPPPPPSRSNATPIAPPLPPSTNRPIPPPPTAGNLPPPPPPMPPTSAGGPPPPPPMPPSGAGGPPPPPLPPGAANPPPLPKVAGGGRDDLLASIRTSGTGGLRKVKPTEKRDRSAAAVPGGESPAPPPPGGAPAAPAGDAGGLAGALQAALNKRKQKVSGSGKFETLRSARHGQVMLTTTQMMKRTMMTIGSGCLVKKCRVCNYGLLSCRIASRDSTLPEFNYIIELCVPLDRSPAMFACRLMMFQHN